MDGAATAQIRIGTRKEMFIKTGHDHWRAAGDAYADTTWKPNETTKRTAPNVYCVAWETDAAAACSLKSQYVPAKATNFDFDVNAAPYAKNNADIKPIHDDDSE